MGKYSDFLSQTPYQRPKSVIYTPKRDDEHPCYFYMGIPPGHANYYQSKYWSSVKNIFRCEHMMFTTVTS